MCYVRFYFLTVYHQSRSTILVDSFIRSYNISKNQEKENYAVIMHPHFSEFNDNAETLSFVTVDNGAFVTTKLRQNLKVIHKRFFR